MIDLAIGGSDDLVTDVMIYREISGSISRSPAHEINRSITKSPPRQIERFSELNPSARV
jgi:hypothetical protein